MIITDTSYCKSDIKNNVDIENDNTINKLNENNDPQMWTEGISSWCHNGQRVTASASGQTATSGQPRSWGGHFHQTQGQGHEFQEENMYCDQTQT